MITDDKEKTLHDREEDQNDDDGERNTGDIEVVKTGKQSYQINKENIHRRFDESNQIGDKIEIYQDDKEDTMINYEETSLHYIIERN